MTIIKEKFIKSGGAAMQETERLGDHLNHDFLEGEFTSNNESEISTQDILGALSKEQSAQEKNTPYKYSASYERLLTADDVAEYEQLVAKYGSYAIPGAEYRKLRGYSKIGQRKSYMFIHMIRRARGSSCYTKLPCTTSNDSQQGRSVPKGKPWEESEIATVRKHMERGLAGVPYITGRTKKAVQAKIKRMTAENKWGKVPDQKHINTNISPAERVMTALSKVINDVFDSELSCLNDELDRRKEENKTLKEENKTLKEENKELREYGKFGKEIRVLMQKSASVFNTVNIPFE